MRDDLSDAVRLYRQLYPELDPRVDEAVAAAWTAGLVAAARTATQYRDDDGRS